MSRKNCQWIKIRSWKFQCLIAFITPKNFVFPPATVVSPVCQYDRPVETLFILIAMVFFSKWSFFAWFVHDKMLRLCQTKRFDEETKYFFFGSQWSAQGALNTVRLATIEEMRKFAFRKFPKFYPWYIPFYVIFDQIFAYHFTFTKCSCVMKYCIVWHIDLRLYRDFMLNAQWPVNCDSLPPRRVALLRKLNFIDFSFIHVCG